MIINLIIFCSCEHNIIRMMRLLSGNALKIVSAPRYSFSVVGNQRLSKDAEVTRIPFRILCSRNIRLSTIPSMLWLSGPEELGLGPPLVWSSRASRPPAFPNFSRPGRIPLLPRAASMLRSETCMMMTGDGTPMIQSRAAIGWEIRTPFTTCAGKLQKPSLSLNPTDFPSPERKRARSISGRSEDSQKSTEKVGNIRFRAGIPDMRSG